MRFLLTAPTLPPRVCSVLRTLVRIYMAFYHAFFSWHPLPNPPKNSPSQGGLSLKA
jgi:hypothetical protein